jgi:Leucine-rich repeat (LRR) protein
MSQNKLLEVPQSLGRATSLQKLILNENQLSKIPVSCSCLTNLTLLDVRRNNIKVLPPNMGEVTSIKTLRLEDNPLVDFQISAELMKKGIVDILWELRRLYNHQQRGPVPNVFIKGLPVRYFRSVFPS